MINMDDPAHQAQRNLVAARFTPRAVRAHEQHVRDTVTEIIDAVAPLGECEAVEAIASRLPAMIIGDILGYPRELWEKVRWWSEEVMFAAGQTSPDGPPHQVGSNVVGVMQDWAEITVGLIERARREPKDDLISLWANTDGWDTKHVLDEVVLVLDGGAETTRTVIGSTIRELALRPDLRQILIDRPDVIATTAVDEFIRWVSPVSNMRRTVTEDHELHGQQLAAGDEVLLLYGSANRDPRVFDEPDVLDVTRTHNRHVAFGFGTHFCLGASLARLELRVMFDELLRRLPPWRLTGPEPKILPATFTRGYDAVHIEW